jgi:hypothetical protein
MFKVRSNLNKVATIIACLTVAAIFASCDKTNGDDENTQTGNIDPDIIRAWSSAPVTPIAHSNRWVEYKANGTFTDYFATNIGVNPGKLTAKGIFRTENGKIYHTKVKETYQETTGSGKNNYTDKQISDYVRDYKFSREDYPSVFNPQYPNRLCLQILDAYGTWIKYYIPE